MSRLPAGSDIATSTGCTECDHFQAEFTRGSSKPQLTQTGKVLLTITGATFGLVCAVTVPFILPALRRVCLPYVPATDDQVRNVLCLLKNKHGRLIDLGSGDGRIVIASARQNFQSEGVELNPWLVWYSRFNSIKKGTSKNTKFYTKNLWKTDLSVYDHIVIFGVDSMMRDLSLKLEKELSHEGQVIVCRFPLLGVRPVRTVGEGIDTVWLYNRSSF